jgi:hypothetical protein
VIKGHAPAIDFSSAPTHAPSAAAPSARRTPPPSAAEHASSLSRASASASALPPPPLPPPAAAPHRSTARIVSSTAPSRAATPPPPAAAPPAARTSARATSARCSGPPAPSTSDRPASAAPSSSASRRSSSSSPTCPPRPALSRRAPPERACSRPPSLSLRRARLFTMAVSLAPLPLSEAGPAVHDGGSSPRVRPTGAAAGRRGQVGRRAARHLAAGLLQLLTEGVYSRDMGRGNSREGGALVVVNRGSVQ